MRSIVVLPLIFALLVSFAATDRRDRISLTGAARRIVAENMCNDWDDRDFHQFECVGIEYIISVVEKRVACQYAKNQKNYSHKK
jgi:hypothetical protein